MCAIWHKEHDRNVGPKLMLYFVIYSLRYRFDHIGLAYHYTDIILICVWGFVIWV